MNGISAHHRAFTLTEILVAITIFMIVSAAMIAILNTSVQLYQRGEQARSANDEVMATLGVLESDLSRTIAYRAGGRIFARAGRLTTNGSDAEYDGFDVFGFLVENDTDASQKDFVLWITLGSGPKRQLERRVFADVSDHDLNDLFDLFSDPATPTAADLGDVTYTSNVMTEACLHFGVWLMGTGDNRFPNNMQRIYDGPSTSDPFWAQADPLVESGWYVGSDKNIYSSIPFVQSNQWKHIFKHPTAVRLTLILTAANSDRPPLRLRTDVSRNDRRIELIGPGAVPTLTGSIIRVGKELIGYKSSNGKTIDINSNHDHGPLRWDLAGSNGTGTGRGIYRSTIPNQHNRGELVYIGEQFSIVRALP